MMSDECWPKDHVQCECKLVFIISKIVMYAPCVIKSSANMWHFLQHQITNDVIDM